MAEIYHGPVKKLWVTATSAKEDEQKTRTYQEQKPVGALYKGNPSCVNRQKLEDEGTHVEGQAIGCAGQVAGCCAARDTAMAAAGLSLFQAYLASFGALQQ